MERRGMPFIHLENVEPGMGFRAFGEAVYGWATTNPLGLAEHASGRDFSHIVPDEE